MGDHLIHKKYKYFQNQMDFRIWMCWILSVTFVVLFSIFVLKLLLFHFVSLLVHYGEVITIEHIINFNHKYQFNKAKI